MKESNTNQLQTEDSTATKEPPEVSAALRAARPKSRPAPMLTRSFSETFARELAREMGPRMREALMQALPRGRANLCSVRTFTLQSKRKSFRLLQTACPLWLKACAGFPFSP